MLLKLLDRLVDRPLPLEITDPRDVEELIDLRDSGFVTAWIPDPDSVAHGPKAFQPPTVMAITEAGFRALRHVI